MDAFLEKLKKSFVERFTSLMEDNGDSVTEEIPATSPLRKGWVRRAHQ